MKTKIKFYPMVYYIEDVENVSDKQMDNLLMCGNKNWNHYFCKLENNLSIEVEEIKNVELIEFDSEGDMFDFLKTLDDRLFLNFSTQHDKPCVLKFA
jgi:hypothetical protein